MSSYVDDLVSSHKVVVFSKTYCPYCTKAKNVLAKYKINDIIIVELENRDDMDEIQDYLAKKTGARSVNIETNKQKWRLLFTNRTNYVILGPASVYKWKMHRWR